MPCGFRPSAWTLSLGSGFLSQRIQPVPLVPSKMTLNSLSAAAAVEAVSAPANRQPLMIVSHRESPCLPQSGIARLSTSDSIGGNPASGRRTQFRLPYHASM